MDELFLGPNFLLPNESARRLYCDYAAGQPIFDYHCHLPVQDIYSLDTQTGRLVDNRLNGHLRVTEMPVRIG